MKRKHASKRTATRKKGRKQGASFSRRVRGVMSRQLETKVLRETIEESVIVDNLALTVRAFVTGVQTITTAGAINTRIGNEVYTKSMHFNWVVKNTSGVALLLRALIVRPKSTTETFSSTLVNFFQGLTEAENALGTILDITNEISKANVTVITDRTYTLSPVGTDYSVLHKKFYVPGRGKCVFSEDESTNPKNKNAYLVLIPRRADNDGTIGNICEMTVTSVHRYTDA